MKADGVELLPYTTKEVSEAQFEGRAINRHGENAWRLHQELKARGIEWENGRKRVMLDNVEREA